MSRPRFLVMAGAASAALAGYRIAAEAATGGGTIAVTEVEPGEDVFAYIGRVKGGFDQTLYRQLIGAANDFKEGDQAIGGGRRDEATRSNVRALLANTNIMATCTSAPARGRAAEPDLADHGPSPVRPGPGLDHGPAERFSPNCTRARD